MLTSIAALFVIAAMQVGAIHVFVEPGFEVLLDSRPIGMSTAGEGGLQIREVPVGEHEVAVKTPWGKLITSKVSVVGGVTADISISSLGLRGRTRGDDSTVEVQVTSPAPACELSVGNERVAGASDELKIDHLRPGRYRVTVKCGSKMATTDIQLAAGRIVTLHADVNTGKIRMLNDRPRITAVNVPTAQDTIMRLPLPIGWRRVFASALVPGVKASSITQLNDVRAEAVFMVPDYSAGSAVVERLRDREEVHEVLVEDYRQYREGMQIRLRVLFR